MTISSSEREPAPPCEGLTTLPTGPGEQAELSQDEQVLSEETRRRAARYAAKLAAALRGDEDAR